MQARFGRMSCSIARPRLADRLRELSVKVGLDADDEAVIALGINQAKEDTKPRPAMRTRSTRLSQDFCRYDSGGDGDGDRVG